MIMMMRSWTGPRLSLATVVLGLGALVSGELLLRWTRPAFLKGTPVQQPHIFSGAYGWTPRPSFRGHWGNGKPFSINAAGYRGPEPEDGPPGAATRIVMLGDSIAFGTGVSDGETFADILREKAPGLEIVNLAVSGYGTDQALLRLERQGLDLQPSAVVLHFCLANDYVDNMLDSYLYDGRTPKPYYVVEGEDLSLRKAHLERSWIVRMGLRLRERSYLFGALAAFAQTPALADSPADDAVPEHWTGRKNRVLLEFDKAANLTLRLVRRMADYCQERRIDFLVVLHPDRSSFRGDRALDAPFDGTRPELAGIRVLDLRQSYAAAGLGFDSVAIDKVGHLSPQGHAFVAEVLRQELGRGGRDANGAETPRSALETPPL
jgi:GDSL-like Lipase/Acylhydrolase